VLSKVLTALALTLFTAYQVICFVDTKRDTDHLARLFPQNLTWPAGWRMFTLLDTWNTRIDFEGWDGEGWVRLPMERWLPTRWDSGYRWERSAADKYALDGFLAVACERSRLAKTRVVEVRWERTPAEPLQPERRRSANEKAERRCDRPVPTVHGKRI
jgi:hypothetical protein